MKLPLTFVCIILLFVACKKDDDSGISPTPNNTCGVDGMRMQAMVGSESFCANTSLFADLAVGLTSNGIANNGLTLTLELDSLTVGQYSTTTDINHVLYTDALGLAWQSVDTLPGQLNIAFHDTAANRIRGQITGQVCTPFGGHRTINASFDLTYTE
ncbi:MAG TPA: hypothetical protein PK760_00325 [Flavobacteriales bacterium]|nr:hypothetical protein [Flavobacteriales bacterium]